MNDVWRARALRYTLIYLLLACVLVALRYQTQGVRPELLALREERAQLVARKQTLEVLIQSRTSSAAVRDWALAGGMIPFSTARKETAAFAALPPKLPPGPATSPAPSSRPPEVRTAWR